MKNIFNYFVVSIMAFQFTVLPVARANNPTSAKELQAKLTQFLSLSENQGWKVTSTEDSGKQPATGMSEVKLISPLVNNTHYGIRMKLTTHESAGTLSIAMAIYNESFDNLLGAKQMSFDSSKSTSENMREIDSSLKSMEETINPKTASVTSLKDKLLSFFIPSAQADLENGLGKIIKTAFCVGAAAVVFGALVATGSAMYDVSIGYGGPRTPTIAVLAIFGGGILILISAIGLTVTGNLRN